MSVNLFAPDGAPNLDNFTDDVNDMRDAAHVFKVYAKYCAYKAIAMKLRAVGRIDYANHWEHKCETLYESLPDWARW